MGGWGRTPRPRTEQAEAGDAVCWVCGQRRSALAAQQAHLGAVREIDAGTPSPEILILLTMGEAGHWCLKQSPPKITVWSQVETTGLEGKCFRSGGPDTQGLPGRGGVAS